MARITRKSPPPRTVPLPKSADVIAERDKLAARVRELEAARTTAAPSKPQTIVERAKAAIELLESVEEQAEGIELLDREGLDAVKHALELREVVGEDTTADALRERLVEDDAIAFVRALLAEANLEQLAAGLRRLGIGHGESQPDELGALIGRMIVG